jgi:2'-5' RNA ligase
MYFDAEADGRVRALWGTLATAGAGSCVENVGSAPHVSLAVFDELERSRAVSALSRFVESCEPLTVSFRGVEMFDQPDRVIYLALAADEELFAVHAELHAFLRSMRLSSSPLYLPGRWIPHCTLAQHVPAHVFDAAVAVARGEFQQFDANLSEIALVEYAPMRTLWRRRLAEYLPGER